VFVNTILHWLLRCSGGPPWSSIQTEHLLSTSKFLALPPFFDQLSKSAEQSDRSHKTLAKAEPSTLTLMSNLREREYRASPLLHPANFPYSEQPNALSAYNICYQEQATGSMLRDSQLIFVRVLGWMLFYALSENILQDLSAAILSCSGNSEKIWGLGKFYVDFWIRTCENATTLLSPLSHVSVFLVRKYKGKTSNVSGNISRPFFGTVAAEVEAKLVPYPSSHSVAKDNVSLF